MEVCTGIEKNEANNQNWIIKWFFLLIPVIMSLFVGSTIDGDFYFLYPTGEYIVNNGLPHTDILSMHSSMSIIVQQWLSSVIFFGIYSLAGKTGLLIFLALINILIILLLYRWISLIIENEVLSAVFTCFTDILLVAFFIVSRPQIFTYVLLLFEVSLLEKYVLTKKRRFLFPLPFLSVALINLHAAMWPMLLVLILPYILGAVPVKFKKIKLEACGNVFELITVMAVCIAAGFINPYGTKSMLYLTTSYGQEHLAIITEMNPVAIDTLSGKLVFLICFFAGICVFFKKERPFSMRFFLLFSGTLLLCLMQAKGLAYFLLFGCPAFLFVIRDHKNEALQSIKLTKLHKTLFLILLISFLGLAVFSEYKNNTEISDGKNEICNHKDRLDAVIEELNKSDKDIILYTNFNDGQYLEFNGYHPYIDGRAELFLKKNNNEFDYFSEYYDLATANIYYKDFVDKYQFNYLILNKSLDSYLYQSLLHDDGYSVVYESEEVVLFKSI